jgi:hypothetical protein
MKPILLLHHESGSPNPRWQNVAGSKVTQRPSEGTPAPTCDRWGHPFPDCVEHNLHKKPYFGAVAGAGTNQKDGANGRQEGEVYSFHQW